MIDERLDDQGMMGQATTGRVAARFGRNHDLDEALKFDEDLISAREIKWNFATAN